VASNDQWHIRIGDASAAHFLQTNAVGEKATPTVSVDEALKSLLAAAKERSAQNIATMTARLTADDPMTDARRIKLKVDAVIDGLIYKLEGE
jgi:hypothetical protein